MWMWHVSQMWTISVEYIESSASSPLLAVWLDQRPVRHSGSAAHKPFSIVGGLSAPHRTSRLRHLSTLQWCWWDGRTSGVTLPRTWPGAVGVMAKSSLSKRPKMPMELSGEDRGSDPSPRPGMRESILNMCGMVVQWYNHELATSWFIFSHSGYCCMAACSHHCLCYRAV